ncbi:MAG: hypothetical protein M1837_005325 [Sclerophora amabilis]|nr:MAG: hypothetical protein M1837_005325 [Sclerophora amabilis]
MASSMATTPDTPIIVKVSIGGTHRKLKVLLRDLGANVLPGKLRTLLAIPPSQGVRFERYSDSAASFIWLDPNCPSVYKQLYRAAKAKLKLRIKAVLLDPEVGTEPCLPTTGNEHTEARTTDVPSPPTSFIRSQPLGESKEPSIGLAPDLQTGASNVSSEPGKRSRLLDADGWGDIEARDIEARDLEALMKIMKISAERKSNETLSGAADAGATSSTTREKSSDIGDRPAEQGLRGYKTASHAPIQPPPGSSFFQLPGSSYSVYCNSCEASIPDAHYHCGICDSGDFDLCEECVESGVLCDGEGHWLIKRFVKEGKVINSTTETIAPTKANQKSEIKDEPVSTHKIDSSQSSSKERTRTCNACVEVFEERNFVTCQSCDDFDLCVPCHVSMDHGHHPGHAFRKASDEVSLDGLAMALCEPGRNARHFAICDGCDKAIYGIRHKCLNCPDWDYCSVCVQSAHVIHPGHRFAPIYEPIAPAGTRLPKHYGITCDGPLCEDKLPHTYISGDRYKCVVCHDVDFCGNCEATPSNWHNKTHPLVKLKTPVKNVTVSTMGEKDDGEEMPVMGDMSPRTRSAATETTPSTLFANAATQVQTVAEMKPTEEAIKAQPSDESPKGSCSTESERSFDAHFVRDTVSDGSRLPPNLVFTQTWTLHNPGPHPWPVGCNVVFVGGDGLQNPQPHASNDAEIAVGSAWNFSVTFGTPVRHGRYISYWRLTGPSGIKFGHKLWCDINVSDADIVRPTSEHIERPLGESKDAAEAETEQSQMIFPKLDKESPVSSVVLGDTPTKEDVGEEGAGKHEPDEQQVDRQETDEQDEDTYEVDDSVSEVASLSLEDDDTEDGFLTDEEYDILDASDEEFPGDIQKPAQK